MESSPPYLETFRVTFFASAFGFHEFTLPSSFLPLYCALKPTVDACKFFHGRHCRPHVQGPLYKIAEWAKDQRDTTVGFSATSKKAGKRRGETGIGAISVRTMAQETLGDFGTLATIAYVFLGYTSMVAYVSKSGEILLQSFNLPSPLTGFLFSLVFSLLDIDQVNQWLTAYVKDRA
ncbi:uncharacterized protein LOC111445140 [Cucurbita moschata]|uniref:Uncharacterized protein LOC111445140 n=1 Tax=Cucurbita moschata TaxID=3662 RepID=A0A6J1FG92_CUCMO|nr:uncharacterized protein LOC111445140 [Cucurbita moschata]